MSDTSSPLLANEVENEIKSTEPQSAETAVAEELVTEAEQLASAETAPEAEAGLQEQQEPPEEPVTPAPQPASVETAPEAKEELQEQDELAAEEPETEEEPEEIDDGRAWYVVHSYSGYENKVKNNLEHRIESMNMQDKVFQVVVPTEEEIEIRGGHRRTSKKRVFPGYILVQMIMDEESWYVVRNTPGVTGFVGLGDKPSSLRPGEVDKIFKRMEMEAPKIKVGFREGETVRIIDGPFVDFVGVVDELNLDKGRVRVMVSFFGRDTPVELDFLQVQKQ